VYDSDNEPYSWSSRVGRGSFGVPSSDPDVKQELKPKACALGGELITLMSSNEKHNRYGGKLSGRFLAFQVLAKKAAGGPQQY
jgi:hypothetical protein